MAMRWQDDIEKRKEVMLGKPVLKGTRLTVEHVLRELGTGMRLDKLCDNDTNIKPEQFQATVEGAGDPTISFLDDPDGGVPPNGLADSSAHPTFGDAPALANRLADDIKRSRTPGNDG